MSATVWDKWYWSDWMGDRGLRACSYAARGLWADMLAIAADADRKGFVMIADRACDAPAIARVTGGQIAEVEMLLKELEGHKVFSRDDAGAIFCRRMVRDAARAKNGKRHSISSGQPPGLPLESPSDPPPSDAYQSPETRSQKESRKRVGAPTRLPDSFELTKSERAYAEKLGFNTQRIAAMVEAFCDHHSVKGTLSGDWAASWRTWVRNEIKFKGDPKGGNDAASINAGAQANGGGFAARPGAASGRNSRGTNHDAIAAGMGSLAREMVGRDDVVRGGEPEHPDHSGGGRPPLRIAARGD